MSFHLQIYRYYWYNCKHLSKIWEVGDERRLEIYNRVYDIYTNIIVHVNSWKKDGSFFEMGLS
jgi:hypothetical protein